MGAIFPDVPPYIIRFLRPEIARVPAVHEPAVQAIQLPDYLHKIVQNINDLRGDANHLEAAHVPIVVSLFAALGYRETVDIVIGQEHIDVSIRKNQKTILISEVKRNWDLNQDNGVGPEAITDEAGK